MSTVMPELSINLTGNKILTELNKTLLWQNGEKLEQDYVISSNDGLVEINYSYIDNIALMMFVSDSPFIVTFTSGTNVIFYEINNIFMFDPTIAFLSNLNKIEISTNQTTGITVSVRIYGAVS